MRGAFDHAKTLSDGIVSRSDFTSSLDRTPLGALLPGADDRSARVAVVYDRGDTPPKITISTMSDSVQTVLADGIAVAIVAQATGPVLTTEDVVLVERVLP